MNLKAGLVCRVLNRKGLKLLAQYVPFVALYKPKSCDNKSKAFLCITPFWDNLTETRLQQLRANSLKNRSFGQSLSILANSVLLVNSSLLSGMVCLFQHLFRRPFMYLCFAACKRTSYKRWKIFIEAECLPNDSPTSTQV